MGEVRVQLTLLSAQPGFKALCKRLKVKAQTPDAVATEVPDTAVVKGAFDVTNSEVLGCSEVDLVNSVIGAVRTLVALESRLESGEEVDLASVEDVATAVVD